MKASQCAVLVLLAAQSVWAQDPTVSYARVIADQAQPRCFAGPRSPFYSDQLTKGDIVDNPDGTVTMFPSESEADLLSFQVGISIGITRITIMKLLR